jgi:long-chain acyl-CoA synthetase
VDRRLVPPAVLNFFEAIGLPLLEAYGVSENIVPIAINRPSDYRLGSVGKPLPGQEVRVGPDGEVFVRGTGLCQHTEGVALPIGKDGF